MSLLRCPDCGNSVSDIASLCPHCGCKLRPRRMFWKVAWIAIAATAIAVFVLSASAGEITMTARVLPQVRTNITRTPIYVYTNGPGGIFKVPVLQFSGRYEYHTNFVPVMEISISGALTSNVHVIQYYTTQGSTDATNWLNGGYWAVDTTTPRKEIIAMSGDKAFFRVFKHGPF